jgi:hypothetical protein
MNDDHKIRYIDGLTETFMTEYYNYKNDPADVYVRAMDHVMDMVEEIDGWGEFYHMLLAKEFDLFGNLVDVGLWKGNK